MPVHRFVVSLCLSTAAFCLPTHLAAAQEVVSDVSKLKCLGYTFGGVGPWPCHVVVRVEGSTISPHADRDEPPHQLVRLIGSPLYTEVKVDASAVGNRIGTRQTEINGTASASAGRLSGDAKVKIPLGNIQDAGMNALSMYVEHLESKAVGQNPYNETWYRFKFDAQVQGGGNVRSTVQLHLNKNNTPLGIAAWYPPSIIQCRRFTQTGLLQLDNCLAASMSIEYNGTTVVAFEEIFTDLLPPLNIVVKSLPHFMENQFSVPVGYDVTIVHQVEGKATGADGFVDYSRTAEFYLDALVPGATLAPASGHNYSDPNRRRTAVTVRSQTVPPANHPNSLISNAPGPRFKIVGGGAFVDWTGMGNILTGSYPLTTASGNNPIAAWEATGKDHFAADPSAITAFAFGLDDETGANARYDVAVAEATSSPAKRPIARASVPNGYIMTGGGCKVNWEGGGEGEGTIAQPPPNSNITFGEGRVPPTVPRETRPGNLLTGSYPDETDQRSWICESKDQGGYSPATITAYAVGIRPRTSPQGTPLAPWPVVRIVKNTSPVAAHPVVTAGKHTNDFIITGCGGKAEPQSALAFDPSTTQATPPGQMLTAVFPVIPAGAQNIPATGCQARSKDHGVAAPGTVTAYSINVLLEPPRVTSFSPRSGKVGDLITLEGDYFRSGMQVRFSGVDVPVELGRSVSRGTVQVPPAGIGAHGPMLVFGDLVTGPLGVFTLLP